MTTIAAKERPILFSAPMVRAILAGKKTQTRRKIKEPLVYPVSWYEKDANGWWIKSLRASENAWKQIRCPYGAVGDRLWVRETWTRFACNHTPPDFAYKADMRSEESEEVRQEYIRLGYPYQWRSSIHMPRRASRLTLEVTDVKVEQLQEVRVKDIYAEGFPYPTIADTKGDDNKVGRTTQAIDWYRNLWESINGAGSWLLNPWVWVISFRRIDTTPAQTPSPPAPSQH